MRTIFTFKILFFNFEFSAGGTLQLLKFKSTPTSFFSSFFPFLFSPKMRLSAFCSSMSISLWEYQNGNVRIMKYCYFFLLMDVSTHSFIRFSSFSVHRLTTKMTRMKITNRLFLFLQIGLCYRFSKNKFCTI